MAWWWLCGSGVEVAMIMKYSVRQSGAICWCGGVTLALWCGEFGVVMGCFAAYVIASPWCYEMI